MSRLNYYLEKLLKDSEYEKIMVSEPLRNIKGKGVKYITPWKDMVKKLPGTYFTLGDN